MWNGECALKLKMVLKWMDSYIESIRRGLVMVCRKINKSQKSRGIKLQECLYW